MHMCTAPTVLTLLKKINWISMWITTEEPFDCAQVGPNPRYEDPEQHEPAE